MMNPLFVYEQFGFYVDHVCTSWLIVVILDVKTFFHQFYWFYLLSVLCIYTCYEYVGLHS